MALSKLSDYLILSNEKNTDLKYGINSVRGISVNKSFMETKANMEGVSLKPYKIVRPGYFAYVTVTSRNSNKISIALNKSIETYICSSSYIVFTVDERRLLPEYLMLYFMRDEFDRYARFNSWGSARETFDWNEMCDIVMEIPSIEKQKEIVDIYTSLTQIQLCMEESLEDLKRTCFMYIEKLRSASINLNRIGDYILQRNEKNSDEQIKLEQGININKEFISPQRSNSNLKGRKIVRKGQFAYCTQLNNENVAIAYRTGPDCVVSSVYNVFEIVKPGLLPEYLMLWLIRPEFGRYVYWASIGSAYEFLNYENIEDYIIPVPSLEIQQIVVDIYNSYLSRRKINDQLRSQLKDICPILLNESKN